MRTRVATVVVIIGAYRAQTEVNAGGTFSGGLARGTYRATLRPATLNGRHATTALVTIHHGKHARFALV